MMAKTVHCHHYFKGLAIFFFTVHTMGQDRKKQRQATRSDTAAEALQKMIFLLSTSTVNESLCFFLIQLHAWLPGRLLLWLVAQSHTPVNISSQIHKAAIRITCVLREKMHFNIILMRPVWKPSTLMPMQQTNAGLSSNAVEPSSTFTL